MSAGRLGPILLVALTLVAGCTAPSRSAEDEAPTPTVEGSPPSPAAMPTGEPAPTPPTAAASPAPPTPTSAAPEAAPPPAASPRPDEVLETIVMRYEPGVSRAPDEVFTVPVGTTRLSFVVYLNATEAGPYTVTSVVCTCSTGIELYGPGDAQYDPTWRQPWGSIDQAPVAGDATGPQVVEGPYAGSIASPSPGEWRLELYGTGRNLQADFTPRLSYS